MEDRVADGLADGELHRCGVGAAGRREARCRPPRVGDARRPRRQLERERVLSLRNRAIQVGASVRLAGSAVAREGPEDRNAAN
jgi:hypothetical protein